MIIPDETLLAVIHRYTRESGVRELERTIGGLARKVALRIARGDTRNVTVQPSDLKEFLGPERFQLESARKTLPPGVATGLAWTETGGDVLYIEAVLLPESDRSERLTLTGQLGSVMQESAKAARSYVVSHFSSLGIEPNAGGVHIHVPAGAIPKDGPSAGVTMATALASLYSGFAVRSDTAMTGEITLTGMVLPVGGIKEKVLAAQRAGMKQVILPRENEKDASQLPEDVRNSMHFEFADRIEDVWTYAIPQLAERLARRFQCNRDAESYFFGRKALIFDSSVVRNGPPIRSIQYGIAEKSRRGTRRSRWLARKVDDQRSAPDSAD